MPISSSYNVFRDRLELVWHRGVCRVTVEVDCRELLVALEDEESRRFMPLLAEV